MGFDHLEALGDLGTWCQWSIDPEAGLRKDGCEATVVTFSGSPVWRDIYVMA